MAGFANFCALLVSLSSLVSTSGAANKYIVTLKPHRDLRAHLSSLKGFSDDHTDASQDFGVSNRYHVPGFQAYTGRFDEELIEELEHNDDVLYIEPDQVYVTDGMVEQHEAGYGLSLLSHRLLERGSDTTYLYDPKGGTGTFVYVVDKGINTSHLDFEGRATFGYNAIDGTDFGDDTGHGTHVAGLACSKTYGVAKNCSLIAVQVSRRDRSLLSVLMEGHQWAINDIINKQRQGRAVINVSLTGKFSHAHNMLVDAAFQAGVLTTTSAGNGWRNASKVSPASAKGALTVSATSSSRNRPFFANWGRSVDLFAPGMYLRSTFIGSNAATTVMSGTSMSSAYAAGLAVYFQSLESLPDAKATQERISKAATLGVVKYSYGSRNLFAYNGGSDR